MRKLILILGFLSIPAYATLGQHVSSIDGDRKFFSHPLYSVHEISDPYTNIREYVANGIVFAVSWTGQIHPDLAQLFGTYYQNYHEAFLRTKRIKGQRSHGRVQGKDLVVEQWGHMRWMQGMAYIPSLLPIGMTPNEIK